jgi:aminoglycoside phosphotransferase (APT) family kinase protein
LPRTLVHGDAKVANFAILPGGRVSAFDWAIAGAGPCTIDIGWYLAVNASRLTGTKDQLLDRYRGFLEDARGEPLDQPTWSRLEEVAVTCGARMLLWSKALALDAGRPGADAEWAWWARRLDGTVRR